jgi:hypothetical protein
MAFDKKSLDDYNDVASRMTEFFVKYPEGSLRADCNLTQVGDRWAAVVKATAMRHPKDEAPGNGHAIEFIPGLTPYTKDSELQNAETAAWGRAIMAVGAADSRKGIASREEVRNRMVEPEKRAPNQEGQDALLRVCQQKGLNTIAAAAAFQDRFNKSPRQAPNDELMSFAMLLDEGAITLGVGG